jgi:hypothetical protein
MTGDARWVEVVLLERLADQAILCVNKASAIGCVEYPATRRPGQAKRDPGPITTGDSDRASWSHSSFQSERPVVMGPRLRGDDTGFEITRVDDPTQLMRL